MCGCNKGKPKAPKPSGGGTMSSQSFALIQPNGTRTTWGSRLEADAERVRQGGTGTIKPA